MRENSIKEDIKIVENYLANSAMNEIDSNFFKNSGWETVDLEIPKSMQHILSDYKRVLKENEELKSVKKECVFREDGTEECLWHCSNCKKEWLFYEGTPEDNELKYCPHCGAKVTKYENYIEGEIEVANKMEEDLIEKLQKKNEELKKFHIQDNKHLYFIMENSISVQTVKDKIEEYKNMLKTCNKVKDIDRIKAINERILELEELLEGRK